MVDYLNDLITRSGINPIFFGWIGALGVLMFIDWLRGR
jgi:hypothetical protein